VVLFVSGVCVGAFGTWIVAEKRIMESVTHDQPPFHQAIMRRLTRELSLDDTQRQRIEKIVIQTQEELRVLRESTRPERRRIMERSLEAMKVELSPEQQKRLEEIHRKMEERRGRKGRGGHRGE
jgi:Spy/CpxP family protein refolding chaperone